MPTMTKTALAGLFVLLPLTFAPTQGAGAAEGAPPVWAADPPAAFVPPPLHPGEIELKTRELAPSVHALLSGHPAVDNSGFVVGERGVLVIDAHINDAMARQIQAAVARVTDKPILYLVNTNYHGDHTFGNAAFPAHTTVIAHRETAARMRHFEHEKKLMLRTVNGDTSVFGDVTLRLPDVTFDKYLAIDLGGRVIELHHFGPGNTPGDTVVYVPDARVAWTGNLVVGQGTIPLLFEGRATTYLGTIARFAETLDVATIIPGHGFPATGAILGRYMSYLTALIQQVRDVHRAGRTVEQAVAEVALEAAYLPPPDSPVRQFLIGLHALNVQQTYRDASDG